MRIALHHQSEVGIRAGRILLAERDVDAIGIFNGPTEGDSRIELIADLAAYDLVITDAEDPTPLVAQAAAADVACVVWSDRVDPSPEGFAMNTLLIGANLATGIAPCLAAHEQAILPEVLGVTVAWTEPGRGIRGGEAVPFPEPVGARWAVERPSQGEYRTLVAPITGEWAAAMARVTGSKDNGLVTKVVGVADLAPHLEGLALYAGAITAARGLYPLGRCIPTAAAEEYLLAALRAGLDVAAYTAQ